MKFKKLHTRLRQRENRNLISNFLSLSLLQIAGYIFPLFTIPYLANVIGVEKYGEIAFAAAIMVYFQTIVDYGFIFSAVRDIARCRENMHDVSHIYTVVMCSRLILLLITFVLLLLLILLVPKLNEMKWVLLASYLLVIGHTLFPDWIFQALERMKYITIFNVLIKLIFTFSIFIFIKKPADYILQPLFISFGYLISGILSIVIIHKWGVRFIKVEFSHIKNNLRTNFDLFLNQLMPNLYNSASILMLGFFHGDSANGIYDAANKFTTAGVSFFSIVSRTFYPFLSRKMDKFYIVQRINLACALIISGALVISAPFIIHHFFPKEFNASIPVLQITAISLFFLAMSNIYGTNFLILNGYEKEMRKITLYSSLISFVIAVPLIYYWSYLGVALTLLFARTCIGVCSFYKVRKLQKKSHKINNSCTN